MDEKSRVDNGPGTVLDEPSAYVTEDPVVEEVAEDPAAEPATVPQDAWDRAVGAWIDSLRSSPIARGSQGAWEHLHDALPKLKELLERELKS